ncbi:MAG: hypothetical protein HYR51_13215 [Candidatus Rokubacteria bacterium]|nr:hypothetical protein [Candidatus Rokubacteria bacterium]
MESDQHLEELRDSDADMKAFLDRLRTTADALDAALHEARRLHVVPPPGPSPVDRAA